MGQTNGAPTPYSSDDSVRFEELPGQANAMANYREYYTYNQATNIKKLVHVNEINSSLSWTRNYVYEERSRIEPSKMSDRLTSTSTGNETQNYMYDVHGNMTRMPHLGGRPGEENMEWDYMD